MTDAEEKKEYIIKPDDPVLVTGAAGFIGRHVVGELLRRGFSQIRCLVRETSNLSGLKAIQEIENGKKAKIITGNLLLKKDCLRATEGVMVIYHLAAGTGTKSFSEAFLNSVVTTRNLIEASLQIGCLKRLVNVSSFAVYKNLNKKTGNLLDETCPVEQHPETRAEAYCYGKVKQDELVIEYGQKCNLPYVIVRPGTVYGPGKAFIPGRVGIDTFGPFLHLGGSNPLPLTHVENCAEAIVLCGLVPGIDGEVFNVVDDDLPTSRQFLRMYKKRVKNFRSIYVPKIVSYAFCWLWERLSEWSAGQIPPVFSRREWHAYWKKTIYSNKKAKERLGWKPRKKGNQILYEYFNYVCQSIARKY